MAATTDMAPNRSSSSTPSRSGSRRTASRSNAGSRNSRSKDTEDELSAQVQQLQDDLKSIAATLTNIAENKVGEAQSVAKREAKNLAKTGHDVVEDVQDEFSALEKQIKDKIREKPLTAMAGAIALGFIMAVVTR